jgi:hypothetical protein
MGFGVCAFNYATHGEKVQLPLERYQLCSAFTRKKNAPSQRGEGGRGRWAKSIAALGLGRRFLFDLKAAARGALMCLMEHDPAEPSVLRHGCRGTLPPSMLQITDCKVMNKGRTTQVVPAFVISPALEEKPLHDQSG